MRDKQKEEKKIEKKFYICQVLNILAWIGVHHVPVLIPFPSSLRESNDPKLGIFHSQFVFLPVYIHKEYMYDYTAGFIYPLLKFFKVYNICNFKLNYAINWDKTQLALCKDNSEGEEESGL